MNGFGDVEPEDSWDPDDPPPVLIDNLFRRLALLGQARLSYDNEDDVDEILEEIAHLLAHARLRDDLTERDQLRILHTDVDLDHVRARLGG